MDCTPEEWDAYQRGYKDGLQQSGTKWLHAVNAKIRNHQNQIREHRRSTIDPDKKSNQA
jgi:hypothetical protein